MDITNMLNKKNPYNAIKNHEVAEKLYDTFVGKHIENFMRDIYNTAKQVDSVDKTKEARISCRINGTIRDKLEVIIQKENTSLSFLLDKIICWYVIYYEHYDNLDTTAKEQWLNGFNDCTDENKKELIDMIMEESYRNQIPLFSPNISDKRINFFREYINSLNEEEDTGE